MFEGFGRLAVGLVVADGAPPAERFTAELVRESVQVTRLTLAAPPAEVAVVLVWMPADTSQATLAELVAWRRQASAPVALIGCASTGSTGDSERALAAGFDDFVAGRAAPREMSRRLRAVARRRVRRGAMSGPRTQYGRIRVDPAEHRLWVNGARVAVTRTELAVMTALVEAAGQSRTRAELLERAWGDEALEVGERAVDNIVMRLRRKLPDPALIVTVRGVGFRLAD